MLTYNTLDKIMTSTTTYTYDANGDRISESIDNNNDVITDSVITYRYNLISQSYDSDNDGTFESVATYTYDGKGNGISQISDNNNDGIPDLYNIYTYDINGNKTSQSIDYEADGIFDEIYTYTYDANGKEIAYVHDSGGQGSFIDGFSYTYDDNGRLISETRFSPYQFFVTDYTYNANTFDVIKDLKIGVNGIDAPRAVNAADVAKLGNINILVESQIQSLLNITTFISNKAATFSLGTGGNQQTFLAINDAINGFSATNDAIIEITGFSGNLAMLAIV